MGTKADPQEILFEWSYLRVRLRMHLVNIWEVVQGIELELDPWVEF